MLTSKVNPTNPDLIAPCGLNCAVCIGHLRSRNTCPGCRIEDRPKPKTRVICLIKTCEKRLSGEVENCADCSQFPCFYLARLDKRYRTKYGTSPVENLLRIKDIGIDRYLAEEQQKWTCPECGGLLCMHKPQCLSCGYAWNKGIL